MRNRSPYTPCKLYYDSPRAVAEGDYLLTPAGSAYWVTGVRRSRVHATRKHLNCLRWPAGEIPAGATVHKLVWYARGTSRPPRRRAMARKEE